MGHHTGAGQDNYEVNDVIWSPRTERDVNKLRTADGRPIELPAKIRNIPKYATNQVKITQTQDTSVNATDAFFGQWDQLAIGVRTGFEIELLRERYVENWQLAFAAHIRADVQVLSINAFSMIQGITLTP